MTETGIIHTNLHPHRRTSTQTIEHHFWIFIIAFYWWQIHSIFFFFVIAANTKRFMDRFSWIPFHVSSLPSHWMRPIWNDRRRSTTNNTFVSMYTDVNNNRRMNALFVWTLFCARLLSVCCLQLSSIIYILCQRRLLSFERYTHTQHTSTEGDTFTFFFICHCRIERTNSKISSFRYMLS